MMSFVVFLRSMAAIRVLETILSHRALFPPPLEPSSHGDSKKKKSDRRAAEQSYLSPGLMCFYFLQLDDITCSSTLVLVLFPFPAHMIVALTNGLQTACDERQTALLPYYLSW